MFRAGFSMSWLNSLLLVMLPLTLVACGFQPLYGTHQNGKSGASTIGVKIAPVVSADPRMGQMLRISLEDKFNPGGGQNNPVYRLDTTLTYSETAIGTARDGTVSRYNVDLGSTYTLVRISDGKQMASDTLHQVGSYNNLVNQYFSTYVSKEDAVKRGVAELAEVYRQRLAAYLTENDGNPAVMKPLPPPTATTVKDLIIPPAH